MLRIKAWWPEAVLAATLALITLAGALGWTAAADEAVRDAAKSLQNVVVYWIAVVANKLGQGAVAAWVLGGGLTALLLWRTRDWRNAVPWVTAYALTYLTTGPLKIWSMRDSPNSVLPNAVEFFNHDATYTMSYPSGHVVNAIVWWGVITWAAVKLWPDRDLPIRLMRIAPPVIVVLTTTYLGHHWLTDGLAAITLGLLIDRIVRRVSP